MKSAQKSFVLISVVGVLIWLPDMAFEEKIQAYSLPDPDDVTTFSKKNETNIEVSNSSAADGVECYLDFSYKYTKTDVYLAYEILVNIGSMFCVPFFALLFFNACMLCELYCQRKDHPSFNPHTTCNSKRSREIQEITKVVFAIVVVFFCSYSMHFLFIFNLYTHTLDAVVKDILPQSCQGENLTILAIRTVALLNSSLNFVIYYVLRKSFRLKIASLFRDACTHRRKSTSRGTGFSKKTSSRITRPSTKTSRLYAQLFRTRTQNSNSLNRSSGGQAPSSDRNSNHTIGNAQNGKSDVRLENNDVTSQESGEPTLSLSLMRKELHLART